MDRNMHTVQYVLLINLALQVFEDLLTYMESLDKILKLNPSKLYPGHGPVVNDPIKRIQYYIHHRNEREKQILTAISESKQPITIKEIVITVYKVWICHVNRAIFDRVNIKNSETQSSLMIWK